MSNDMGKEQFLPMTVWNKLLNSRGKFFSCLYAVSFGIQLYFVKIAENSIPAFDLMLLRSFVFLLAIPFIDYEGSYSYQSKDMLLYVLYGVLNSGCRVVTYVALSFAQMGNVAAITSNMAIPSAFLGLLALGERITCFHVLIFVINAIGIVFVSRPPLLFDQQEIVESKKEYYGAMLAVVALIGKSVTTIVSRKLSYQSKSDPWLFSALTGVCGIVITSLILIFTGLTLPGSFSELLTVLGICLASLSGNIFVVLALQYEPVVVVSVLNSLSLVVAYSLQIVLLKVLPGLFELLGVVLILGTNLAFLLKSHDE